MIDMIVKESRSQDVARDFRALSPLTKNWTRSDDLHTISMLDGHTNIDQHIVANLIFKDLGERLPCMKTQVGFKEVISIRLDLVLGRILRSRSINCDREPAHQREKARKRRNAQTAVTSDFKFRSYAQSVCTSVNYLEMFPCCRYSQARYHCARRWGNNL